MVKKILSIYIVALFALIHSCAGTYGMDDEVREYHPRSSRSSLFKTALVGLGLMLSPQSVGAVNEFGGCYLATGILNRYGNGQIGITKNLMISQIRTCSCNILVTQANPPRSLGKIVNTDLKLTGSDDNIINTIQFCHRTFNVYYPIIIDYGFNMSAYNCFYPVQCTNNFRITIESSGANRRENNLVFDNTFSTFMTTEICPITTNAL